MIFLENMKTGTVVKFILSLAIPLITGGIAGIFTAKAIPVWYASLNKPSFNPPDSVFGPVWTILYVIMGISVFLVWMTPRGKERNLALLVYFVQLALNFAWSFLFFYFRSIGWALLDIVILWIVIQVMLILFFKVRPAAAFLNIPYLLWVTFATILNTASYILN